MTRIDFVTGTDVYIIILPFMAYKYLRLSLAKFTVSSPLISGPGFLSTSPESRISSISAVIKDAVHTTRSLLRFVETVGQDELLDGWSRQ